MMVLFTALCRAPVEMNLPSLSRPNIKQGSQRRVPYSTFDKKAIRTGEDVANLFLMDESPPPDTPFVFYLNFAAPPVTDWKAQVCSLRLFVIIIIQGSKT